MTTLTLKTILDDEIRRQTISTNDFTFDKLVNGTGCSRFVWLNADSADFIIDSQHSLEEAFDECAQSAPKKTLLRLKKAPPTAAAAVEVDARRHLSASAPASDAKGNVDAKSGATEAAAAIAEPLEQLTALFNHAPADLRAFFTSLSSTMQESSASSLSNESLSNETLSNASRANANEKAVDAAVSDINSFGCGEGAACEAIFEASRCFAACGLAKGDTDALATSVCVSPPPLRALFVRLARVAAGPVVKRTAPATETRTCCHGNAFKRVAAANAAAAAAVPLRKHRALCDACNAVILGVRYKCLQCKGYDLCAACEPRSAELHPCTHIFAKVKMPLPPPWHRPTMRLPNAYEINAPSGCIAVKPRAAASDVKCAGKAKSAAANHSSSNGDCEKLSVLDASGHVASLSLYAGGAYRHGWQCDGCGSSGRGERFHCARCTYDLCKACGEANNAKAMAKKGPSAATAASASTAAAANGTRLTTFGPVKISGAAAPKAKAKEPKLFARFVSDTLPDGTQIAVSERIVKQWTLRNSGDVAWPANCALVHVGGDAMHVKEAAVGDAGAEAEAAAENAGEGDIVAVFGDAVAPNDIVTATVNMQVPSLPGRYVSYYRMQSPSGVRFGHRVWCDLLATPTSMMCSDAQRAASAEADFSADAAYACALCLSSPTFATADALRAHERAAHATAVTAQVEEEEEEAEKEAEKEIDDSFEKIEVSAHTSDKVEEEEKEEDDDEDDEEEVTSPYVAELEQLVVMGFPRALAAELLDANDGDLMRAVRALLAQDDSGDTSALV